MSPRRMFSVDPAAVVPLLREPFLWLLVALMLAGGAAAYRMPYTFWLDIGGGPGSPVYDRPYIKSGFNVDSEPFPASEPTGRFRWAFDNARLVFPGLGSGTYLATLKVVTAQPALVSSAMSLDGTPLTALPILPAPRTYHVLLPSTGSGLDLQMVTPPFEAPGDPRPLAFGLDKLQMGTLTRSNIAWPVLGWLAGCVALLYLLLRRTGLRPLPTAAAGLAIIAVLVWWLAFERLSLGGFAARLCLVMFAGLLLSLLIGPLLGSLSAALGLALPADEVRALTGLVILAWIIRMGGLLHPQAYTSDLGLHMHNLDNLIIGEVIFTEDLPARAGGGPAPYPPAQYVMLAPWRLLAGSAQVTRIGNTLADSLVIVALWLVLRTVGAPPVAAVFAAGLYLFATPLLNSLSIGEMANVWGQALVGLLMLVLVRWRLSWPERRLELALCVGLAIALLGHFGVFLSLLLFLGVYTVLLFPRGPWLRFASIAGMTVFATAVLYYSSFVTILAEQGGARVPFGWERLRGELAAAFGLMGQVGPLLGLLALAGLVMLLRDRRARVAAGIVLGPLLAAWFLSTSVSLASLLWVQQALRWEAFLFPALALAGGIALAGLHRLGRAGQGAAYALLALVCLRGVALWYWQIATYQH